MNPRDIRSLRERLQMTQEEFAAKLGLKTRGAVSKLENGAKEPKGPLLVLLQLLSDPKKEKVASGRR